jgi:hypothetical protein
LVEHAICDIVEEQTIRAEKRGETCSVGTTKLFFGQQVGCPERGV